MDTELTPNEQKLVDHAKEAVVKYNKSRHAKGGVDTLYAFAITEEGKIYDGAAFDELDVQHAVVCGERHALANMAMKDYYNEKLESIVVASTVPSVQEHGTFPCGTCRQLIWQFGKPDASVILMQYIQENGDEDKLTWTFHKIEKYSIKDLLPHPYEPKPELWD